MNSNRTDTYQQGRDRLLGYYAATAHAYDRMHLAEGDEHDVALRHIAFYLHWIGATSVLDTGCGTGRTIDHLRRALPDIAVRGNDSSRDLLTVAVERGRAGRGELDRAVSERLPYRDGAFDAVVATGVLHHVPAPELIIGEMLRVARKAVFISDSNIYGRGPRAARALKLALSRVGVYRPLMWLRRGGKHWFYSEGDGVAYSYSLFDSYRLLARRCAQVIIVPTQARKNAGLLPLLQSSHALACGFTSFLTDGASGRPAVSVAAHDGNGTCAG